MIDGGVPDPSPRDTPNSRTLYINFFYPQTPDEPITNCPDQLPAKPTSGFPSGPLLPALQPNFTNSPQDFTVVDAQAFPTSKKECKKGGWRQFGFKNQGQRVSFVATSGKHQP